MSLTDAINAAAEQEPPITTPETIKAWLDEEVGRTPINRVVNYQDVIDLAGPSAMHAIRGALEAVLAEGFDPDPQEGDPPAWYAAARTVLQGLDPGVTDAALLTSIAQSHAALADTTPGAGVGTTSGVVMVVLGAMEATEIVSTPAADALRTAGGETIGRRWSEYGLSRSPGLLQIAAAIAPAPAEQESE